MPRVRPEKPVSIDLQHLSPAPGAAPGSIPGQAPPAESSAASHAHSLQSGRVLLVGTDRSTAQLYHALGALNPVPSIVGRILMDKATHGIESACEILGGIEQLIEACQRTRADLILLTMPASMPRRTGIATELIAYTGIACRTIPTLEDQLAPGFFPGESPGASPGVSPEPSPDSASDTNAAVNLSSNTIGDHGLHIDLAKLIDRQPRPLDEEPIRDCLAGKVVLITGAGGSIGSELAQIVCRFGPAKLVLVERAENSLFQIDREIARAFPDQERCAELHDVTHAPRTLDLVDRHQPHVIFHAAAHKHVPMMEDHPAAAIENNFYGTRSIADAAHACGVQRFVMISTDKAVNPSSVMGASKRLAELYIQHENKLSPTIYSMVRFGNVLGSACSVLPIWSKQIAQGGPVTVTHPDMTRYFMTIPEAASLVLQAGAYARGGEVFLLDMGDPVNVLKLAERFIAQHGLTPDEDIQIAITGVRPGEKMFEVLAYDGEDMTPTPHPSVRIWESTPPESARLQQIALTFDRLREKNAGHQHAWRGISKDAIQNALRNALPEMVESAAG